MKVPAFRIIRFNLDASRLRVRFRAQDLDESTTRLDAESFPGYMVISTAPFNIEDALPATEEDLYLSKVGVEAIARQIHRIQSDPTITDPAELVLVVHGGNIGEIQTRNWYGDIYRYISQDDRAIRRRRNLVFVGYRWPSEKISLRPIHLWRNARALPNVVQATLFIGITITIFFSIWSLISKALYGVVLDNWWMNLITQSIISCAVVSIAVAWTLLMLRISAYSRNVYRAINFGVPDLIELISQIDQSVVDLRVNELRDQNESVSLSNVQSSISNNEFGQKVQLNLIGHGVGALVLTNVVQVLSDVFDRRSIRDVPPSTIGHTLSLGRLLLVAPDIPVSSIISGRANRLESSIRRFNESYLFSSEGDLALKLVSAVANFISFPTHRSFYGDRLGCMSFTNRMRTKGIVNLPDLKRYYGISKSLDEATISNPNNILQCLFIKQSSRANKRFWRTPLNSDSYLSLGTLLNREGRKKPIATFADLFTFFDCTDYRDYRLELGPNARRTQSREKVGLLTRAGDDNHIHMWNYCLLMADSIMNRRDVHGGYFHGEYSRQLIYRLAFLGFEDLLRVENDATSDYTASEQQGETCMNVALDMFSQNCAEKGIHVYLSPLRYRVDAQGADMRIAKELLLETIRSI